MNRRGFLRRCIYATGAALTAIPVLKTVEARPGQQRPNVIFIMADDMGYGDLSGLNPDSRIPTPHMDRLAREGMLFTDAHKARQSRWSWRPKKLVPRGRRSPRRL